ncbi:tetratricopeptide repeat protein 36 [Dunckerocampus dactyliophorus]|uniref:tetratricopeptide repeat protein 36 n=1 Tax=Dunckerocampus dactyliophorus TaxID=161453 RepID=UPI002406CCC2|nr:tetratricopeptide repeat protein 36 [Dunckerocampus dactyliophorus]
MLRKVHPHSRPLTPLAVCLFWPSGPSLHPAVSYCCFFMSFASFAMASAHDRAVLQAIFSPTTPFGDVPGLNQEQDLRDDDSSFDADSLRQVKDLEERGVLAAETGDLQEALRMFCRAIRVLPQRASAYNNRAQVLRLQGNTAGALEDLDSAISLSGGRGRTACQALVQRGLLRRLARQDDEARADFQKAAALGSEFARQQAVMLNPYAALCNKMLSEVIDKLRNPQASATRAADDL